MTILIAHQCVKTNHPHEIEYYFLRVQRKSCFYRLTEVEVSEQILLEFLLSNGRHELFVSEVPTKYLSAVDKTLFSTKEVSAQKTDLPIAYHQSRRSHFEAQRLTNASH
jgi:hypothetical protein